MGRRAPSSPQELITSLLDRGFTREMRAVVDAITRTSRNGLIARRLSQLDDEMARLAREGLPLTGDNPVLRALLADVERESRRLAVIMDAAAPEIEALGYEAAERMTFSLTFPGLSDSQVAAFGWNRVDPEAIRAAVGIVDSEAWATVLSEFDAGVLDQINNLIIRGIVGGKNPLRIAEELTDMIPGIMQSRANTLLRTLQLQSYRRAQLVHEQANARLLDKKVRIAALDSRTCLACWSLHGSEMEIGEPLLDHHNGRCTAVLIVKDRPVEIETGPARLNRLLEQEQRGQLNDRDRNMLAAMRMNNGAALRALESGALELPQFVGTYQSELFGDMIHQRSLMDILGNNAQEYYAAGGA